MKKALQLRRLLIQTRDRALNATVEGRIEDAYNLIMRYDRLDFMARRLPGYHFFKYFLWN